MNAIDKVCREMIRCKILVSESYDSIWMKTMQMCRMPVGIHPHITTQFNPVHNAIEEICDETK